MMTPTMYRIARRIALHKYAEALVVDAPAAPPRVAYGPHDYDQVAYTKEAVYQNLKDVFGHDADISKHDDGVSLGFKDYMGEGLDVGFEIVIRLELGYVELDDDTKRKFPEFKAAVEAVDGDSFMDEITARKLAEVMGRIRRRIRR